KTADMAKLRQAQAMTKAGESPDVILDTTGWERRPDKKWRFEFSDRDATINQQALANAHSVDPLTYAPYAMQNGRPGTTLGEVLNHPELYAAYPKKLTDAPVRTFPPRNVYGEEVATRGGYDYANNTFYLREGLSPEEARSVLLHETAHGVQ